jgi:hypothetical protein
MSIDTSKNLKVGPSELMFLSGLALMFLGLLVWIGLGVACTICGATLVISALINNWMQHREMVNGVV